MTFERDILTRLGQHDDESVESMARLHARLVEAASSEDLVDVAYRILDTPVGSLLLAATTVGVVRIAFDAQCHDAVLDDLARKVSPRVLRAPARLDLAARQLDEYFSGRRHSFDLPLDLQLARGFRRLVLGRLTDLDYGSMASYAAVAAALGNPKAARAVGTACAANPVPVVVPCHRVVRSDGSAGGYVGGVEAKRALLALETANRL
jgi:methylated-DNA-[protein]-cysteine S-methyltransferase